MTLNFLSIIWNKTHFLVWINCKSTNMFCWLKTSILVNCDSIFPIKQHLNSNYENLMNKLNSNRPGNYPLKVVNAITFWEFSSLFDPLKPIQIYWGVNLRGTKFFGFSIKWLMWSIIIPLHGSTFPSFIQKIENFVPLK